ncbi:MAG: hypothetical protein EBU49_03485, partial [Proteobacteria bacterium]|nr:hypothetical protein [Pseudomonadota bacterium]
RIKGKVTSAMVYPLVVLTIAVGIVTFLMLWECRMQHFDSSLRSGPQEHSNLLSPSHHCRGSCRVSRRLQTLLRKS